MGYICRSGHGPETNGQWLPGKSWFRECSGNHAKKPRAGVSLCGFLEMLHLAVNPKLISRLIKDLRLYLHPTPTPETQMHIKDTYDTSFCHFPSGPVFGHTNLFLNFFYIFLFPCGLMRAVWLWLWLSDESLRHLRKSQLDSPWQVDAAAERRNRTPALLK